LGVESFTLYLVPVVLFVILQEQNSDSIKSSSINFNLTC